MLDSGAMDTFMIDGGNVDNHSMGDRPHFLDDVKPYDYVIFLSL
ncbi:MAG: hypothetical protein AAGA75_12635 [Cyanobacteria bacterium P01_E01_bin.6]